jgi:hypothetical protein
VGSLGGVFQRAGGSEEPEPPEAPVGRGESVDLKKRFADHVRRERGKR